MKSIHLLILTIAALLFMPAKNYGQVTLGAAASQFVIFTASGAVSDNASAHSHVTGDVGTSTAGLMPGFGNVDGVMHPGADLATAACVTALTATIAQLNASVPTSFPSATMGNGASLFAGVHSIAGNATLNLNLFLDAQNVPNAEFIIKIGGTLGAATNAKVILINGAQACHVYWQVTGAITMASLVTMRGNIISNGAILMGSGDSLEGRAFTTVGAIGIDGITAFKPIGCGSPVLTGPSSPNAGSLNCYTLFASVGPLANTVGTTTVIGDVGKDDDGSSITGWSAGAVTGTLHSLRDASTIQAKTDLSNLYNTLNAMVPDIELLYPAQFGHDLVLSPHVYLMNSAATFTDSLYLDAQNNANAVFVIKIAGALTTSTYSKVKLINGAQAKNVFWVVQGAVNINNYSVFRGTIIVPVGAINFVNTGIVLDGRALTMAGAITTQGLVATMSPGCASTNITRQPVSLIVCKGELAQFSVKTSLIGATYQWRKGLVNITNGAGVTGATSDTLSILSADISDTSSFYNVVINGVVIDSSYKVSLKVNLPPIITNEPTNVTYCNGDSVYLFVKASGTTLTYQWFKDTTRLKDTLNISGSKTDSLKVKLLSISDTSSAYHVVVSGICAPNDTSNYVSIMPKTAPVISQEPLSKTVCAGDSVYLIVKSSGLGLSYQWRRGNVNLLNNLKTSGVTSDSLKIRLMALTDTAFNYNVIVTGNCGLKDTSANASIQLSLPVSITSAPLSKSVCLGDSAVFIVKASGSGLTYQWRNGLTNLTNSAHIKGVNTDTLTIYATTIVDTSSNYNVVVSGTCSVGNVSIAAALNLNTPPSIITQPINNTTCMGTSTNLIVKAIGTGLTYTWRRGNVNLINGVNLSGVNTDTLKFLNPSISDTSSIYNVVVSGSCNPNATSNNVSLNVNVPPTLIAEPVSQIACSGSTIKLIIRETGTGLTYQWRKGNVNLLNTVNISGVQKDTLTILSATIADTSSFYNVIVNGSCAPADTSINVSVGIQIAPAIITQPTNETVCMGANATFRVTAVGTNLTYTWRKGTVNLINSAIVKGVNTDSLTILNSTITDTSSFYNVVIGGTCIPNVTSNDVRLNVNTPPTLIAEPVSQSACNGSMIQLIIRETGTGLAYQWRKGNLNLLNGANISGVQNDTLTISSATLADTSSFYNVIVTGTCAPADTSVFVSVNILLAPSIITQPANEIVCEGANATFHVSATGSGLTYQWRKGTVNLSNNLNLIGTQTDSLKFIGVVLTDQASDYNVVISGTCPSSATSNNASLTVVPLPISLPLGTTPICAGTTMRLYTPTLVGATYQWSGPAGYFSTDQDPSIPITTLANSGNYVLTVKVNGCNSLPVSINIIVKLCNSDLNVAKQASVMNPLIGRNITFTITVTNLGPDTANAVEVNEVIQSGYSYISSDLTKGTYSPVTGIWTVGRLDSGQVESMRIVAKVNASGSYINTAIVSGFEGDIDLTNNTVTIEPIPTDFNIPEGFSPNGDGVNDLFVIRGIDYFPSNTINIYNRWGNKVFDANPYKNTWNGKTSSDVTLGGNQLPIGTYFYVIDLGDGSEVIKGTIYLSK